MKKWTIAVVGLVAVSLWFAPVSGQDRHGMGWRGPGMTLPLLLQGAGLTDEQKARVREIVAAHRPTFRTLFGQLRAAQDGLAEKLFAGAQTDELASYAQRVAQLREQIQQEGLKVALEARAVLTPEQLTKAAQLRTRIQTLRAEIKSLLEESP